MVELTDDARAVREHLIAHGPMTAAGLHRSLGQPWKRSAVDQALNLGKRAMIIYKTHNPRGGAELWCAHTELEIAERHARDALRWALVPILDDTWGDPESLSHDSWALAKLLRLPDEERLRLADLADTRSLAWDAMEEAQHPRSAAARKAES